MHVCLSREPGICRRPRWSVPSSPVTATLLSPAAVFDVPRRCYPRQRLSPRRPRRQCFPRRPRQDQRLLFPRLPQHHLLPPDSHRHHRQEVSPSYLGLSQWHRFSRRHSQSRRRRPRAAQECVTTACQDRVRGGRGALRPRCHRTQWRVG